MKILILDDDDTRHRKFAHWFAGYDVTHAFTVVQFNQAYLRDTYDYVFLDHDLNDNQHRSVEHIDGDNIEGYIGPCQRELTGKDAAHMISESPGNAGHVIIHSWNPTGAEEMEKILAGHPGGVTRWVFNPKEFLRLK